MTSEHTFRWFQWIATIAAIVLTPPFAAAEELTCVAGDVTCLIQSIDAANATMEMDTIILAADGAVTGLELTRIVCRNQTQSTMVAIDASNRTSWDCEAAGLGVDIGDTVAIEIEGIGPFRKPLHPHDRGLWPEAPVPPTIDRYQPSADLPIVLVYNGPHGLNFCRHEGAYACRPHFPVWILIWKRQTPGVAFTICWPMKSWLSSIAP